MATLTPSRIARRMAADMWPDVQFQRKIAAGTFGFSCAGHGGVIAVIGVAPLNANAVTLARKYGKTGYVAEYHGRLITSERYTADSFNRLREAGHKVHEVWIGEEDCDWSLILLANDAIRAEAVSRPDGQRYFSPELTRDDVVQSAKDWNPDYYSELTGETLTGEDSYMMRKREFETANRCNYVTRAAWGSWHEKVPAGQVGVFARRESDGDERYFLIPEEEYDKREGSFVVDTERHPELHERL